MSEDGIGTVVILFEHATGPVPADAEVIGTWRMDTLDGGPTVTAVLGPPPTVKNWWSETPRRGAIEAWYRETVQPAISAALVAHLRAHALVVTPEQAVELLSAMAATQAMRN